MNRPEQDGEPDQVGSSETENADRRSTGQAPFVAELISPGESIDGVAEEVRIGSPFREDPADLPAGGPDLPPPTPAAIEAAYADFGPFLYTAMGASAAAVVVFLFAAAGAWWFPTGGALVAILGTVLSIVGLFSTRRYRYAAIAMLPLHMALFFLSYARSLG